MNKNNKDFIREMEKELIFYPAYAYRRCPNHKDIIKKWGTHSYEKADKRARSLLCDDDAACVFVKINKEWYTVSGRTKDGILKVSKESETRVYKLHEIIKQSKEITQSPKTLPLAIGPMMRFKEEMEQEIKLQEFER